MTVLLTIVHVIVAVGLILFVLLQAGRGAGIGAAFGGSSQTMFGAQGPTGFLGKLTTGAAILFMVTSLLLTYVGSHRATGSIVPAAPLRPAAPAAPSPQVPAKPGS